MRGNLMTALLIIPQLLALTEAASATKSAGLQIPMQFENSNPERLPCEPDRITVAMHGRDGWKAELIRHLGYPGTEETVISARDLTNFAKGALIELLGHAIQTQESLLKLVSAQSNNDASPEKDLPDRYDSPATAVDMVEFEYMSFKMLLVPLLIAMEAYFRLKKDNDLAQILALGCGRLDQSLLLELITANGCTSLFRCYAKLIAIPLEGYIELIWSHLVPSKEIVQVLGKSHLESADLHLLLLHAISAHRLALVEYIVQSEALTMKRYTVSIKKGVSISCDPLMYAISKKTLRDQPKVLANLLDLLLDHNMDYEDGNAPVGSSATLYPLSITPSTPLELAIYYSCWEATSVLLKRLDCLKLRGQISRALLFASDVEILENLAYRLRNDISFERCVNGVSLWAYAAFNGNFELLRYLSEKKVSKRIAGSRYSPVIAALVQPNRNFDSIGQMVVELISKWGWSANETICLEDFSKNWSMLGFSMSDVKAQSSFTALDVAEALALYFPAANNVVELIRSHGGVRAEDLLARSASKGARLRTAH